MNKKIVVAFAVVAAVAVAFGVWRWTGAGSTDASPSAAGPASAASAASGTGGAISVTTVRAEKRDYPVTLEATGTVTALNSVDVRAQVSSVVSKVHIREGQFVKAGELLFTLDARADQANVVKAQAQMQKDLASLADARRQLARSKELLAQNFISKGAVDTNQALVDAQEAAVAADRAAVEAERVALSYARIVAPGAGRAGAINVFPGSMVQPGATPLVTITQLDPMAVAFNLPQRNLNDALQALRGGGGAVTAVLPEGRGTITGKLQFVDNTVDAGSGTVRVKAVFDNKDEKLWPGAFVGVKLVVQTLKDAVVVPQAATVQGPRGNAVYVVEAGKAALRPIEVVYGAGTDAVVTGVRPGERVVVDGRQNLRPGASVADRSDEGAAAAARARRGGAALAEQGGAGTAPGASAALGSAESP